MVTGRHVRYAVKDLAEDAEALGLTPIYREVWRAQMLRRVGEILRASDGYVDGWQQDK